MRLTDSTVAALKVPRGKSEIIVFDDALAGFGTCGAGGLYPSDACGLIVL